MRLLWICGQDARAYLLFLRASFSSCEEFYMNWIVRGMVFGLSFVFSLDGVAGDSDYLGVNEQDYREIVSSPSKVPDVPLANLERRFTVDGTFSSSSFYDRYEYPEGSFNGVIGVIARFPFDGGHALYSCLFGRDRFTSTDAGCEGHKATNLRQITGYVATTQWEGTRPLYRCLGSAKGKPHHFDSVDSNCEGIGDHVAEGVIGYIWH